MMNRNTRRFGFGFNGPVQSNSSTTSATSSTTGSTDSPTPEANRRHSLGKLPSQSTQSVKGSPSPNRNSMKLPKEPTTPVSGSKPANPPAKVKSPPTTAALSSPLQDSSKDSASVVTTTVSSTTTINLGSTSTTSSTTEQSLIKVCVRIRPLLNDESSESIVWQWKDKTITPIPFHLRHASASSIMDYTMANPHASFAFDHLFAPEHSNHHIFEEVVRDIVTAGMNGYHGSVFTYGQTSSGKTFTMYGSPAQQITGVINLAVQFCFDAINAFPEREFLLRVSYLEVYNEQVRDLLGTEPVPIKILFDPKLGTVLSGVKEHVVFNPSQVYQLIKQGEAHRHIGVTDMNAQSSRAHTLFKVIIESKERNNMKSSAVRVSTLNLVDLAGSENAKMTNSVGERAREAKYINQSLLTLSTIIQRLSEEHQKHPGSGGTGKTGHLPYRDSKLTRLLETALDGNARIAIVCNISPTSRCMEESVNTLKFGTRAKLIRINAKINENVDDKTLLRAYREEIEQLKLRLKELEERQSAVAPALAVTAAVSETHPPTTKSSHSTSNHPVTPTMRRDRSRSHDDNQSIEVTSATKIDIEETIHQIEDKLGGGLGGGGLEDDQQKMLQMIEAMERLILKADNNSKQQRISRTNNNKAMGVSSSETLNDPHERSMRVMKSGEGVGYDNSTSELSKKISLKKAPSFSTGIPISTSHRSTGIPRRGGGGGGIQSTLSRSNSNDNKSLASLDIILEGNDHESHSLEGEKRERLSPKQLKKKSSFVSVSSPTTTNNNSQTSHIQKIEEAPSHPVISSQSFERVILQTEAAEKERELHPENDNENNDNNHEFGLLKRQTSIPLSDLQRHFTKLENTAERVGVDTSHLLHHNHSGEKEKDLKSRSHDLNERLLGSISPLTMCTESAEPDQIQTQSQLQPVLVAIEASTSNNNSNKLPAPIQTTNLTDSNAAFVFSPSATANRGNLPPPSPYENHILSASHGNMTPMKNRILRRVKDEALPPLPATTANTASNINSASLDQQEAMERMRQLAISNDTLDSFQSSIDPRFAAPNDVLTEDDSVLLGVSRMLTMLKDYISNNKQRPLLLPVPPTTSSNNSTTNKPTLPTVSTATATPANLSSLNKSVTNNNTNSNHLETQSVVSEASSHPSQSHSLTGNNNNNSKLLGRRAEGGGVVSRDEYEKLKQDLALKEADNHFLQEELEQKDKMLGMLTEGLKEVQESQMQWLTANQDLSQELEKTLLVNQILKNEITRLNQILLELTNNSTTTATTNTTSTAQAVAETQQQPPSQQFVSEEVALLLASPIAANRPVSHNQHLYLSRSRPVASSNHSNHSNTTAAKTPNHNTATPSHDQASGLSSLVTTTTTATTTVAGEPLTPYQNHTNNSNTNTNSNNHESPLTVTVTPTAVKSEQNHHVAVTPTVVVDHTPPSMPDQTDHNNSNNHTNTSISQVKVVTTEMVTAITDGTPLFAGVVDPSPSTPSHPTNHNNTTTMTNTNSSSNSQQALTSPLSPSSPVMIVPAVLSPSTPLVATPSHHNHTNTSHSNGNSHQLVIDTPLTVSSTATTTIASPDVAQLTLWTQTHRLDFDDKEAVKEDKEAEKEVVEVSPETSLASEKLDVKEEVMEVTEEEEEVKEEAVKRDDLSINRTEQSDHNTNNSDDIDNYNTPGSSSNQDHNKSSLSLSLTPETTTITETTTTITITETTPPHPPAVTPAVDPAPSPPITIPTTNTSNTTSTNDSPGVHIPPTINNVLDWKQASMDLTNLHSEKEAEEYFPVETTTTITTLTTAVVTTTVIESEGEGEGEEVFREIPSPVRESRKSPLSHLSPEIKSPSQPLVSVSASSLDKEDASVMVHVEKVYHSCDSAESFGSIKESW